MSPEFPDLLYTTQYSQVCFSLFWSHLETKTSGFDMKTLAAVSFHHEVGIKYVHNWVGLWFINRRKFKMTSAKCPYVT
jgi:hypothetical protein